jgi:hypothetical protein
MHSGVTHKIVLSLFLAGSLILQLLPCGVRGQAPPSIDLQHKFNVYDVNGHPIVNPKGEIEGTPFFIAGWKPGSIQLVDGRIFPNVQLELDLEKQTVHYRRADGNEIEIESGLVRQLTIRDTLPYSNPTYQFVCGYPPVDNQNATSFYLLLDSGKVCFLECIWKKFYEKKNEYSGETSREYRIYNDFYVYSQGKITRIKRDTKFFLALTNDKVDRMEAYLQNSKTSPRSEEDIRRFIHYYNGLP